MLIPLSLLLPIEVLLNVLINQYLLTSYCLTFVMEKNLAFRLSPNISFMFIHPNNSDLVNQILNASEKRCSDYIIQMQQPEEFMAAFEKVNRIGDIRRSDRKLIFLPIDDELYNASVLLNILQLKETGYVANVLLVSPSSVSSSDCASYDLVTHKFVGPDAEIDLPLYLDRWDSCTEQFEKNANLFPHDISNMYGKVIKVAAFTYKPYVMLDLDPSLNPLGRDGFEMRIIEEFCRWINCTVEIVRDDENEWGEIYDNLTGVGVFGNIVEDRADIGITALGLWFEECRALDVSTTFIKSDITCITPAARVLSSWNLPLLPFTWLMWVCLIFTFFYASLALFISQRSANKIFLSTFMMMITQTRDDSRDSWRIRSITGWLLVTGLVIDNAYSGGLASSFTVPKFEASIDTIQDIVDRKLEWGATHDAWVFSISLSEEPLIKQLISQFRSLGEEELKQKSFTRTMAFGIEHLPGGNFGVADYITKEAAKDLELMLESLYYLHCSVMARKSSPYTPKISELVGRLHQSGLVLCWETQVVLKYLDFKVQQEVKLSRSKQDTEIKPLSLKKLVGIYYFYFAGLTASIICFFVELISRRAKTS